MARKIKGFHKMLFIMYGIEGILNLAMLAAACLLSFIAVGVVISAFLLR